jgi:hypothetical protein
MNFMAPVITPEAERYLEALAAELEIEPARYESAERSYTSLGTWLHRAESTVLKYDPQVYVQGSFRLGTAIKPLNDSEDYDVDSVCEFRSVNKGTMTQRQLKDKLGVEIKSYAASKNMTKPVKPGRRCWKLEYADGAQFHMDIVPAVPNAEGQRLLLEQRSLNSRWTNTAIAITDNEHSDYEVFSDDWPRSNPKGYGNWFRSKVVEVERKKRVTEAARAEVESMPTYRIRTPLQSAVMILKRHRDVMFEHRFDERPISVIITTLAAHAYGAEESIGKALVSILTGMDRHIKRDAYGNDVIENPTDPLENFADKWPDHPERREAFYEWLEAARQDFLEAAKLSERRRITDTIARGVGRTISEKANVRSFGRAAPAALTTGLVGSEAQAKSSAVRLQGGGRNA